MLGSHIKGEHQCLTKWRQDFGPEALVLCLQCVTSLRSKNASGSMGNSVSFFLLYNFVFFTNTDNFLQNSADIGACSTVFALTQSFGSTLVVVF